MNTDDVRERLRKLSEKAGGQRALARDLGISPSYLNDVILGRKKPGAKILTALGLERDARYVKA